MRSQTRQRGVADALARLQAAGWRTVSGHAGRRQFWLATRGEEARVVAVRTTAQPAGRLFTRRDPEQLVPALQAVAVTMGADPWIVGVAGADVRWEPASAFAAHIRRLRRKYVRADPAHRTADGLVLGRKVANMWAAI